MSDNGVSLVDHQLHTVRPATLIGISDQFHVVGIVGFGEILGRHFKSLSRVTFSKLVRTFSFIFVRITSVHQATCLQFAGRR